MNSGSCKDPKMMHLMRCLMLLAKFQFSLYATLIAGQRIHLLMLCQEIYFCLIAHGKADPNPPPTRVLGPTDSSSSRLDLHSLHKTLEFWMPWHQQLRKHASSKKSCLHFCLKTKLDPVPVSEHQLCRYVYLSTIRHLCLVMRLPDSKIGEMSRMEQVIKYAKHNPGSHECLPTSPVLLLKMRKGFCEQVK